MSDVLYWQRGRIGDFILTSPIVLGHESSGTVVEIGSNVKNVKVGDRVAIEPGVPCRHCDYCRSGSYNLCADTVFAATPPHNGTLSKYYLTSADYCYPLPEDLDAEARVLSMLLAIASQFGVNWVWLDVAMISGDREIRAMSVNAMNLVYTTAKLTLVCDRLLLSIQGGNYRERVLALAASDWMTRVWTMQEALLSKNLVIVQRGRFWSADKLLESLIFADDTNNNWQVYGAVRTLFAMVNIVTADPETILERTFLFCRERKTTKEVDLARASYPLFVLEWPGPNTSLIEGQIKLLEHLGEHAAYCAGLFGAYWASLSVVLGSSVTCR
jgi:hypothetical protein